MGRGACPGDRLSAEAMSRPGGEAPRCGGLSCNPDMPAARSRPTRAVRCAIKTLAFSLAAFFRSSSRVPDPDFTGDAIHLLGRRRKWALVAQLASLPIFSRHTQLQPSTHAIGSQERALERPRDETLRR